jgi:hypothetical protein
VHESTSKLDHIEAMGGRAIVAAYDAERSIEKKLRSQPERPVPPAWLAAVWAQNGGGEFQYPQVREDRYAELGPDAARSAAMKEMNWTGGRGDQETRAAAAFFQSHPSEAAKTVTWFQSIWNAFDTFDKYPLQAFMYASASPVTTPERSGVVQADGKTQEEDAKSEGKDDRAPKSPLWAAYQRAVDEHLDPALIDEAYFRAHYADMKTAVQSDRFKDLYDLAPPNYRVVVEAYIETTARAEKELEQGRPIGDISRGLFVDGLRDLVKRKSVGMLWTADGLKNLATLSDSAKLMVSKTKEFAGMVTTSDRPAAGHSLGDSVISWFRDERAFRRAVADKQVDAEEVWEITQAMRGFSGVLNRKDLERLRQFEEKNSSILTPGARASIDALLKQGPSAPMSQKEIADAPVPSAAHGVPVDLTDAQREMLRREFHIAIPNGATKLTEDMFAEATFSEPDRREDKTKQLRTWPLRLSDLTGPQLRRGLTMAGSDGTLSFDEIMGGIRNVQARVRSQLINDFNEKYPVAPGGILQYSANVLAMNHTYGEDEFYGMVPNAIMPVDNDGKPKNQLWRDFTNAYDQHKKTGKPSMQEIERLWIRAHMEDFRAVDGPDFQAKEDEFWKKAAQDPALESMAVYAKGMIMGRQVFEKARANHMTEEAALDESLKHFASTIATSGTAPFWREDLDAIARYFRGSGAGSRKEAETDDRGLPTDRAIAERAASGMKEMGGLAPIIAKGRSEEKAGTASRVEPSEMIDLSKTLSKEQIATLDPTILDFYRHPTSYDISAFAQFSPLQAHLFHLLGDVANNGKIPAAITGKGGGDGPHQEYPVEQNLWKDDKGRTHWDRDVVVKGEQQPLFHATFELVGDQLCETFHVHGVTVPLYFNLQPTGHGLTLNLDKAKSSRFAPANINFTAQPAGDGQVVVTGRYEGLASSPDTRVEFHIHKHAKT